MHSSPNRYLLALLVTCALACKSASGGPGDDGGTSDSGTDGGAINPYCANPGLLYDVGDPQGHASPLTASAGQARAGRITAAQLPPTPSGLSSWEGGDFVLANDRIAMVIEDVDDSDLYDPWGGKPVGLAHVQGGQLVDPSDFGEILFFVFGPSTVVTEHVGVLHDGSDGMPATIRAEGRINAIPFIKGLIGVYWLGGEFRDRVTRFAIDYVLAPDSEYVDVFVHARHTDTVNELWSDEGPEAHGFMYSDRLRLFQPTGIGFQSDLLQDHEFLAFVDPRGVGYAFEVPGQIQQPLPSASGFAGSRTAGTIYPKCDEIEGFVHQYARIYVGGPDADPLLEVVARAHGEATRAITGQVLDSDANGRAGLHVHVVRTDDHSVYLTRATTDASGNFTVHVPSDVSVDLYAYAPGEALVGPDTAAVGDASSTLTLPEAARLHVDAALDDQGNPIPYKLQVLPDGATTIPAPPSGRWGEDLPTSGRLYEEFVLAGDDVDLALPAGSWQVVASRGFRYQPDTQLVTVTGGDTPSFSPQLELQVETPGIYCADFHIHTRRSNDSPDEPAMKLRAGLAEDLDVAVRSDHEYVEDWDDILTGPRASGGLASGGFAIGVTSVELTTMEFYGHFGVVPVVADPSLPNGGAPRWQDYPTSDDYDRTFRTLLPPELFARVHARAESPALIVNHPRGGNNYFGWTGYDGVTGTVGRPERWSEDFEGIEVFNDSNWLAMRSGTVRDWLSFLDRGVHVFAVGSSDTHNVNGSPMGYDRTCIDFNPDGLTSLPQDPADRRAFGFLLRDAILEARMAVNGGVFVDVVATEPAVDVGMGGTASGLGTDTTIHLTVRAADYVDVDTIEIVVDGQTYDTIDVATECTQSGSTRCELDYPNLPVGAQNSYVVVAAYGNAPLEPVMRNRIPFGMTNAIFLQR